MRSLSASAPWSPAPWSPARSLAYQLASCTAAGRRGAVELPVRGPRVSDAPLASCVKDARGVQVATEVTITSLTLNATRARRCCHGHDDNLFYEKLVLFCRAELGAFE